MHFLYNKFGFPINSKSDIISNLNDILNKYNVRLEEEIIFVGDFD